MIHKALCRYVSISYPGVIFNVDLSGVPLSMKQAKTAKMLRSHRGFPDFILIEPRGGYHGLFIEIKREGTKLRWRDGTWRDEHIAEQAEMIDLLLSRGYMAGFGIGLDECIKIVDEYMKFNPAY